MTDAVQAATTRRVNLYETEETGITEVMAGPWKSVRVLTLPAGGTDRLASIDGEEHALFVIDGGCTVHVPETGTYDFGPDHAFALPLTGIAELTAGEAGMRALVITLRVTH